MKNKKILVITLIGIVLILLIFYIFFYENTAKNLKIGNNRSSQEIVNYILNISSYETEVEVEIKSNKNENKYRMRQVYNGPEDNWQEIIEPSNIAGVKIIKEGKNLKLENSNLNLTSIFKNCEYISENSLDLSSFIEDYKKDEKAGFKEKNNQIIMKTAAEDERYRKTKTLYINKENALPTKMEIQDANQNIVVYILYNEVNVNS